MSAPFLPPPKAGGGLPAFPGLAPGGGMPDFSKFAQPREKATVAMPAFANVVPKTKPPPPGSLGQSGPPSPKKKSSSGGHLALFTATHKQWAGQVELSANGKFTRVGKDGGLWSIDWDSQRENDDGDRSGALRLTWSKWGLESLRTTDGGRTFKCPEYQFELELMSTVVPGWIVTGPDDSAGDSAPAPPPPSSSSNDSSWRQTEPAPSSSDGTWLRGQTVPDKDGDGPGPAAGGRSEPEPAKQDQPTSRPVRPGRMGFKMPSRAERATGLTRKYKEIGSILMSEEAMKGVEPTAVVSFLKKSIADIHQLSILTMKYEKVNEDDTKEIKETTAAEVIGMTKASMAALERCRLLNYLENDDEKRMKVLMPVCVKAYEVVEPYLTWTLDGDGKDKIAPELKVKMLLERVSMHGYSHGVPQRANVARKFPDKAVREVEMAEHDRKWGLESEGIVCDCGDEIYFLKKKDKHETEFTEVQKQAAAKYADDAHVQKLLKEIVKKRAK